MPLPHTYEDMLIRELLSLGLPLLLDNVATQHCHELLVPLRVSPLHYGVDRVTHVTTVTQYRLLDVLPGYVHA